MKLFIFFLLLIGNLVQAGTLGDAYREVCQSMVNQPDIYICVQALRGHSYFEIRPLRICKSLTQNPNKSECVKIIGDITYDVDESQTCEQKNSDEDKIECLIEKGHNYFPEKY